MHYKLSDLDDWFNLTATFKSDSTVVTDYKEFKNWGSLQLNSHYISSFRNSFGNVSYQSFYSSLQHKLSVKPKKSFVFWYVSNCETPSRRENYMIELLKHINVDIYGGCESKFKNSRPDPCKGSTNKEQCDFELFGSYKFYLAFENSLCNEYVTEKYWKIYTPSRLFQLNIVPVVKGARGHQYKKIALKNSYIDAQVFNTPKSLADYLIYLNKNDTAYFEYFDSKLRLFETLQTHVNSDNETYEEPRDDFTPFCHMCQKLHDQNYLNSDKNSIVKISKWFNPSTECWDRDEPNWVLSWIVKIFGYCI